MALRIGQFVTRYRVSKRHQERARLVDRFVRDRLPADLAGHLGPSLARQPAIVRIRCLSLHLDIPAKDLQEDFLSRAWMAEFGRALFTALAYPAGAGPFDIYRAESLAVFIASAIGDHVDGTTPGHWEYREFEAMFRLGRVEGTLALLCEWPLQTRAILLELERTGLLARIVPAFNELALERIFAILSPAPADDPPPIAIADLIAVARTALQYSPHTAAALRTRAYALRLFVLAIMEGKPERPVRSVFHTLVALHYLLGIDDWSAPLPRTAYQLSPVAGILEAVQRAAAVVPAPVRLRELRKVVENIREATRAPLPVKATPEAIWITSDWCGLFFLCSTLQRLEWTRLWARLPAFQQGGISFLIAGLALSITELDTLDPAAALFAGVEREPAFQEYPPEARRAVLHAAGLEEDITGNSGSWDATFTLLANTLLRSFASRIRGFRQAALPSIVRGFLARRGRIRVEQERIVVYPEPHAFNVALKIAGLNAPCEAVSWLDNRTVDFQMEDV